MLIRNEAKPSTAHCHVLLVVGHASLSAKPSPNDAPSHCCDVTLDTYIDKLRKCVDNLPDLEVKIEQIQERAFHPRVCPYYSHNRDSQSI